MVSVGRALLQDVRSPDDVAGALLQAGAALLLTLTWAVYANPSPPLIAWSVFAGVGVCSWLFLATVTRSARDVGSGAGASELRGVLLVAILLTQLGFLLRLTGQKGSTAPAREWLAFLAATLVFLAVREVGRRRVHVVAWAVLVGVLLVGSIAAVILTPHPNNGPRLRWEDGLPAAGLAAALAGALALWWAMRSGRVPPEAIRVHVVAVPPLAVYAFTRDPGAAALTAGASAGAVIAAGRVVWGSTWWLTLRPVALGTAVAVGVGAVFRVIDPYGIFTKPPTDAPRDLVGVWQDGHGPSLGAVAGPFAVRAVILLALVFAVQVGLMLHRVLRIAPPPPGDKPGRFARVWAAALGGQLLVSVLAPLAGQIPGFSVPPSVASLPLASDGVSFMIAFVALGLLFATAQPSAETHDVAHDLPRHPDRRSDHGAEQQRFATSRAVGSDTSRPSTPPF
ncbi:hypothetical protein GCM10022255_084050 [Dactylosporangium darangshiense]|uniref:Cell division protein FtsW n=1 Tax=Dactylosporangium darangshiense TaxID=579108 RepID=A0ABP8DM45_9ACTN